MKIYLNEVVREVELGCCIEDLVQCYKPKAQLYIINGYPVAKQALVKPGDQVILIEKGVMPPKEELEALLQARHTPQVHGTLKQKKVLIIGLGGLGSNVAINLARVGVGTLIGVDFDVVEPSNLNRQQYFVNQIGMKKTAAMAQLIKAINPFVTFLPKEEKIEAEGLVSLGKEVDLIIEAVDESETKAMIAETVLGRLQKVKLISASGMAGYFESNCIQTKKINERFYLCGDGVYEAKPGCGLMAPRVSIVAGHEANLAIRLLLAEASI